MKKLFNVLVLVLSTHFIHAQCQADFTSTVNGATVSLTNTSTFGTSMYYSWTPGDGNIYHSANPGSHTYAYAGTYIFCVSIGDSFPTTCTSSFCDTIVITNAPHPPCDASFSASVDSAGFNPTYFSNSSPYAKKYIWDFGDGNHDTTYTGGASHQFGAYATYTVCLTTITTVNDTCTSCKAVNSTPCIYLLNDSFGYSMSLNTATFTNFCSGAANPSYTWHFGDGNSSSLPNPSHTYQYNGTYSVCLVYADSSGCTKTYCKTLNVTAASQYPCNALFAYYPDTVGTNPVIAFNDQSTLNIVSWAWVFPGGSPSTANYPSVHVSYPPGTYNVSLTVTNQAGIACSYSNTVNVGNGCYNTQAGFTMQPDTTPHVWIVNNNSKGAPPISYSWNWGDGSPNSSGVAPTHTYAQAGWYSICLNLVDANGCGSSVCDNDSLYKYMSANSMITMHVVDHTTSTGINNISLEEEGITLYPNPSNGQFTVGSEQMAIETLEVYNVFGQLVHSQNMKEQKTIDLTAQPAGVYWLKLQAGEKVMTGKVMLAK